jgi:hypothetical protein
MELSDDEKIDREMPGATPSKPDYPWGLRISLTEKELEKLDLDCDECEDGDMVDLRAFAVVTSKSTETHDGKRTCRIELQIQKLAVENEMTEDEDEDK